jgi:hypothetical protein
VPVITAAEFDRRAEAGGDLSAYIDWQHPVSPDEMERRIAASRTASARPHR